MKAHLDRLSKQIAGTSAEICTRLTDHVSLQVKGVHKELTTRMVVLNTGARECAEQLHTQASVLIEAVRGDTRLGAEGGRMFNEKLNWIAGDHEECIQHPERGAL